MPDQESGAEEERARALRHLHELIAALDRRVPHSAGTGEIAIAHDAAALRTQALDRIAQLEAASGEQ